MSIRANHQRESPVSKAPLPVIGGSSTWSKALIRSLATTSRCAASGDRAPSAGT